MSIAGSVAFFVSPRGRILFVKTNHIGTVIDDPIQFGLTMDEIRARYAEYGEQLGIEGTARRKFLLQLVKNGWIRLRRYPNRYFAPLPWIVSPVTYLPDCKIGHKESLKGLMRFTKMTVTCQFGLLNLMVQ